MPQSIEQQQIQQQLQELKDALDSGVFVQVRRMLNSLPAVDVARLLESSPPKARNILWDMIEAEHRADILQHIGDDIRAHFLRKMNTSQLTAVAEELDTDDLADVLQQLPNAVTQQVLRSLDTQDRQRVERVLSFPEDTAGGLMDTDTITVRPSNTLDVVFRYLRRHSEIPPMTDNLLVVNRRDEFIGLLPIAKMLVSDLSITVREIMITEVEAISADLDDAEVATLFERHDWVSAPVVDKQGKLLGRITIDDVVDVIREEADHSLMSMAGLDEDEDTFAPVLKTTKRRSIWLGLNVVTAVIASMTIGLFKDTIEQVVALAILMPIVASMGGIAGNQTLIVVIRGMALGQIGKANARWLMSRELGVGVLNGILWASVVAVIAVIWFEDPRIGIVLAAAMLINLVVAAIAGAGLPLLLRALKIDPALAGSMFLTTITDVIGFMTFLGLATLIYA